MKKQFSKKVIWKTALSLLIVGVFIFMAIASEPGRGAQLWLYNEITFHQDTWHEEPNTNIFTCTEVYRTGNKVIEGTRKDGEWDGYITISYESNVPKWHDFTEDVFMIEGKRHGPSIITRHDGSTYIKWYWQGIKVSQEKYLSLRKEIYKSLRAEANSAYEILTDKYQYFHFMLYFYECEDNSIKHFMDTLEIVLNSYSFQPEEFDDYYDMAIEVLEETPYDSLIEVNTLLTWVLGIEDAKRSELRKAVIKRYRNGLESTYDMICTTFPGYLEKMHMGDISDEEFEIFCQDLDDSLTSYGPLDVEDPFFTDSIDSRLDRAIWNIYSLDDDNSDIIKTLNSEGLDAYKIVLKAAHRKARSLFQSSVTSASSTDVAEVVIYFTIMQCLEADIIKKSVKEAYFRTNNIPGIPVVATDITAEYSETNTVLAGFIIDDGGAEITERGIAWAEHYNPVIDNNMVKPELDTGNFTITINDLTVGTTYYARAFATNSVGTAYGNCVSFVPGEDSEPLGPSDLVDNYHAKLPDNQKLTIYPNPASAITTFSFPLVSSKSVILTIIDMKGRQVLCKDFSYLTQGSNQVKLDLSFLQCGMYICQLTVGTIKNTTMLTVSR